MRKRRIIGTAILGNIVEYYDFGIYAVFAPLIGATFFPMGDKYLESLVTFAVFAIGFLMRPLGSVIFGHIGDKFGRKIALNISITGMSLATLAIGILPSYSAIGISASLILFFIRLLQGLCIGGEGTGSVIFILEHMSSSRVSFIGSVVMASNIIGTMLANLVGICINNSVGLDSYTWRYGFILGALIGVIGIYFRSTNAETPVFQNIKDRNTVARFPILSVIQKRKETVMLVIAAAAATTSTAYMVRGYLNTFLIESLNYTTDAALGYTFFTLLGIVAFLPIFGLISDKVGHANMLFIGASCAFFTIIPVFMAIVSHNTVSVYLGLLGLSILCAAMCAPIYPYAIRSFPPEIRYSGVAISWNLGNALFGGTTPLICAVLSKNLALYAPAYYLMFTTLLFLSVNYSLHLKMKKMRQHKE